MAVIPYRHITYKSWAPTWRKPGTDNRAAVNRGRRHEARAVIVYLNSTFYKRQTTILLKKLFEKYKLKGTISDVFPAEESSRALALSRYAAEKRFDKSMTRTRVINRGGTAYLQHTTSQDRFYKDANISEDSLRPYFDPRQAAGDGDRQSGVRQDRVDRATRDGPDGYWGGSSMKAG